MNCECGRTAEYMTDPKTGRQSTVGRCRQCFEDAFRLASRDSLISDSRSRAQAFLGSVGTMYGTPIRKNHVVRDSMPTKPKGLNNE